MNKSILIGILAGLIVALCIVSGIAYATAPTSSEPLPNEVHIVDPESVEWSLELVQNGYQNSVRPIMPKGMTNAQLTAQFNDTSALFDAGYTPEQVEDFWARQGYTTRQAKGIVMATTEFKALLQSMPANNI